MPDKVNPEVEFELGGKKRKLRFDLNAMAAFEDATGKSLFDPKFTGELSARMNASTLRALLWAMLRHDEANLSLEDVGAWIDSRNMALITKKVAEAFTSAMPETPPEDKQYPPLPPASR